MNSQANKPIDIAYMSNDKLRDLQNLNSKLDRIESHDTDYSPKDYKCQDNNWTCSRNDYKDTVLMIGVPLR